MGTLPHSKIRLGNETDVHQNIAVIITHPNHSHDGHPTADLRPRTTPGNCRIVTTWGTRYGLLATRTRRTSAGGVAGSRKCFLPWLEVPADRHWVDVGCGTGALTATVLAVADPAQVIGVDTSEEFLDHARARIVDPRSTFRAGDARSLPLPDRRFDAVVSGLALNFVPDPHRAAAELDEGHRFPMCRPEPLGRLWADAGLDPVTVRAVEVATVFADFDDYWRPFLGGQGPAPGYAMSLTDEHRRALRDLLRVRLPSGQDGSIPLTARAWAVRGTARDEPP